MRTPCPTSATSRESWAGCYCHTRLSCLQQAPLGPGLLGEKAGDWLGRDMGVALSPPPAPSMLRPITSTRDKPMAAQQQAQCLRREVWGWVQGREGRESKNTGGLGRSWTQLHLQATCMEPHQFSSLMCSQGQLMSCFCTL